MEKVSVSKETARQIVESGVDLDQLIEEKLPPVNFKKSEPTPIKSKVAIWCLSAALMASGFWVSVVNARAEKWKAIKREKSAAFAKQLAFKNSQVEKWRSAYWALKNESSVMVKDKETANPIAEIEEKTRLSIKEMRDWRDPRNGGNLGHKLMVQKGTTPEEWEEAIAAGVNLNHQKAPWNGKQHVHGKKGPTVLMTGIMRRNWESVLYLLQNHRDKLDLSKANENGTTAHDSILAIIENGFKVPQEIEKLLL